MVLTSNVFSHIRSEDLQERIGSTNKEFSYRAILTLFSRNDTASRNLQKEFLSRIFLFPRENILTILKNWNLEKYQKLITSIIESLEHLLPHDDFKKAIFTRIFSEKNVLNDEEFKTFFKNSTTESLKYLPLLDANQVDILFEKLINNLKKTHRTLSPTKFLGNYSLHYYQLNSVPNS